MAIGTLAEYKVWAGISGTSEDTRINAFLDYTLDFIEGFLGRSFTTGAITDEAYDGNGGTTITLRSFPVASIQSVKIKFIDGSTTTLDSTAYRLSEDGCSLARLGEVWDRVSVLVDTWSSLDPTAPGPYPSWPVGTANVLVSYTTSADPYLGRLKMAQFQMMDELRGTAGADLTKQSERIGSYGYSRATAGSGDANTARAARWAAMIEPMGGGAPL